MMADRTRTGPEGAATGPSGPVHAADQANRHQFWERSMRGWDLAFYGLVAVGAVTLALDVAVGAQLYVVLGLLATLVLAYTLLGRRIARRGAKHLVLPYLGILIVITTAITYVSIAGTILLFIAYSQIWFFSLTRRGGIVASVLLTVGVFGVLVIASGFDSGELPSVLAQGTLALTFSLLLGLWITQVAEQSEQRAELIEQLESAQAELATSHHAAGVTAERERMAQEIHDTLAQGFTSVVMLAQAARADLGRDDAVHAIERLELVERTARDNLAEARALVAAFAPVGLAESGLAAALLRLATRFTEETGVAVDVDVDEGCGTMGREREVILLRSAQEALTNVRRHAGASHVRLTLACGSGGEVRLEVADDGRGLDEASAEGFGLRGMRERVASGGGRLAVAGVPTGGTRVLVTLPDTTAASAHAELPPDEGAGR